MDNRFTAIVIKCRPNTAAMVIEYRSDSFLVCDFNCSSQAKYSNSKNAALSIINLNTTEACDCSNIPSNITRVWSPFRASICVSLNITNPIPAQATMWHSFSELRPNIRSVINTRINNTDKVISGLKKFKSPQILDSWSCIKGINSCILFGYM